MKQKLKIADMSDEKLKTEIKHFSTFSPVPAYIILVLLAVGTFFMFYLQFDNDAAMMMAIIFGFSGFLWASTALNESHLVYLKSEKRLREFAQKLQETQK